MLTRFRSLGGSSLLLTGALLSACISQATSRSRDATARAIDHAEDRARARPPEASGESASPPRARAEVPPPKAPVGAESCKRIAARIATSDPTARARRGSARAGLARADAEGSLPAPELSFELWDFPIGDPARANREGMYMVGLSQRFPAAGLSNARARKEVEVASANLGAAEVAKLAAWAEAMHACVDWAGARRKRQRLGVQIALLDRIRGAVGAARSSGGSSLADEANVDAERAATEQEITLLEADERVGRGTLLALGGIGAGTTEPPAFGEVARAPSLDRVIAVALERRGEVASATSMLRVADAEVDVAGAESKIPEIGIEAAYMQMPKARAGLEIAVSMSLPWLWSGGSGRRTAAAREVGVAHAEAAAVARAIRTQVTRTYERFEGDREALASFKQRVVPAVDRVLEAEQARLTGGGFDLSALVLAIRRNHDVSVELSVRETALHHDLVDVETAAGGPLDLEGAR